MRRQEGGRPLIQNVYCHAHARRKFKEAQENFPDEAEFFIDRYRQIYSLENEAEGKPPDDKIEIRKKMLPLFEEMKKQAMAHLAD